MLWSHALDVSRSGPPALPVVVLPVGMILPPPVRLLLGPARHAPLGSPSRPRALRRKVPVAPIARTTDQEQATAQRAEPLHELEQESRTSPPRSGQPLLARAMHGAAADGLFRPCRTARSANFGPSPLEGAPAYPTSATRGKKSDASASRRPRARRDRDPALSEDRLHHPHPDLRSRRQRRHYGATRGLTFA